MIDRNKWYLWMIRKTFGINGKEAYTLLEDAGITVHDDDTDSPWVDPKDVLEILRQVG